MVAHARGEETSQQIFPGECILSFVILQGPLPVFWRQRLRQAPGRRQALQGKHSFWEILGRCRLENAPHCTSGCHRYRKPPAQADQFLRLLLALVFLFGEKIIFGTSNQTCAGDFGQPGRGKTKSAEVGSPRGTSRDMD